MTPAAKRAWDAVHSPNSPDKIDEFETILLKWHHNMYGSFYSMLFDAIAFADDENLAKLEKGFPKEVHAWRLWKTTWISQSLIERGLLEDESEGVPGSSK